MIKVNLSTLIHTKPGSRETVVLDLGKIVIGDLDLGYMKGELHFTRVAYGILTEGVLATEVKTECTRCLERFYTPINIELEDTISLPGAERPPEKPDPRNRGLPG